MPKTGTAHFECHLVLLNENGKFCTRTKGICKGKIALEKRGTGGFGYDPVFIIDKLNKTMAQLTEDEKTCTRIGKGSYGYANLAENSINRLNQIL